MDARQASFSRVFSRGFSCTPEAAARAVTTTPSANTLAGFRRLGPLAWGEQWEAVEAGDVPVDVYVPSPAEAEVWVCDGAPDVDYDWFSSCVPDEFSDGFASRPLWIVDGQAASRVLHRTDVDLSSALVGAVADAWLPSLDDVDAVLSLWARTSSVQAGRFSQPLLALLFREGGADLVWERVPFDLLVDVVPDWVTAQVLSRFSDPDLVWNLVGDGWSGTGAQLEAAAAS